MLARRPYSVAELRRALERKFPSRTGIAEALARLRGLGVLDDRKLAEHYASVLAQERRFGRHRIRRELKARLVDYKTIDPAIERTFKETDERELLEQVLAKKVRTLRLPLTSARLSSLCQSLMRRGFSAGDIMKAVRSRPELRPVADGMDTAEFQASEGKF